MNFWQGHSGTKVQCESCLFSQGKTPEFTKMGEIHELFVLALSLVWFAGATPDYNCDAHRVTPEIASRFPRQDKPMVHCDVRVWWKVASDLRFRAAISEPETPSFCGISGDLALSSRKSLSIAILRFWCAKTEALPRERVGGLCPTPSTRGRLVTAFCLLDSYDVWRMRLVYVMSCSVM